jgi:hypothetical protein
MKKIKALMLTTFLIILGLITIAMFQYVQRSPANATSSFSLVRDKVYSEPQAPGSFPTYSGLGLGSLAEAVVGHGDLTDRIKGTLDNDENFKPMAPKLLHPMGVCAEAEWAINGDSYATGVFAPQTDIHAIVRLSAANADIAYVPGDKRIFGMALKLFPSGLDTDTAASTVNVFTLDQAGLDGEERQSDLLPAAANSPLYFQNAAFGGNFVIRRLSDILRQYDAPGVNYRTLEALAGVDQHGNAINNVKSPLLVRFVPVISESDDQVAKHVKADLREEILSYDAGQIAFEIWISKVDLSDLPNMEGYAKDTGFTEFTKIGRLTLGQAVVSQVCDQSLHFHHNKMAKVE